MEKEGKIKRVHICGTYASGKTTLARKIHEIFGYKIYGLDEIKYIRKFDKIRSIKDRLKKVKEISKKKTWITEGAWLSFAKDLFRKADIVIFLEIPERVIYRRMLLRHIKRKFSREKYHNLTLKSTFKIMQAVKRYFHDPEHYITFKGHKEYLKKYAKKSYIIKNNADIQKLLSDLK